MLKTYPRLYLHKYTGYILSIHIPLLSLGKSVFSSTNAYSDCIILVLLIQIKEKRPICSPSLHTVQGPKGVKSPVWNPTLD